MVNFLYCLTNLLFFYIPLLYINIYIYIHRSLSKICCPFGISTNFLSVCEAASGLICDTALIILSEVLLPIESMVGSLWEARDGRGKNVSSKERLKA